MFQDIACESELFKDETLDIIDTNELFEGDLITIDSTPKTKSWKYVPLFSEKMNGEIRVWQVGFDEEEERLKIIHGVLVTSKGEVGENLQTTYHPVVVNQSGRSLKEQALLQARKRYMDKYDNGYLPTGETLPSELSGAKPMLAAKYKKKSVKKFPVSVMKKIDGIRGLFRIHNKEIQLRSRTNKIWNHMQHIKAEIKIFLKYLPLNSELDGELYIHGMALQDIKSIQGNMSTLHSKHDEMKYYIFDLIEPKKLSWEKRYTILVNAYKRYLEDGHTSKTFKILQAYNANSHEEIEQYFKEFLKEEYEGLMIRRYECVDGLKMSQYKPGSRTNSLMKHKPFEDKEVEITGYENCVGSHEGAIKFVVKDNEGNEFKVTPKATIEKRRQWYEEGEQLIGKQLTIRYTQMSNKGVPLYARGITIRDYE